MDLPGLTETVESSYAIVSNTLIELAPQAYVSCVQNSDDCGCSGGCEGAIAELAYNYYLLLFTTIYYYIYYYSLPFTTIYDYLRPLWLKFCALEVGSP